MDIDLDGQRAHAAYGPPAARAPTHVLVHGAGMSGASYAEVAAGLNARGIPTLAVDLPGHGASEGPMLPTVEAAANWLARFIEAAGLESVTLVGHSFGALVALDCAARHPERVGAIGLIAVSAPMPIKPAVLTAARDAPAEAIDTLTDFGFPRRDDGAAPPTGQAATRALFEAAPAGALFADLVACDHYSSGLKRAAEVTLPARLILGEFDRLTPMRHATPLIDALGSPAVTVVPAAGHMLLAETPAAVVEALASAA